MPNPKTLARAAFASAVLLVLAGCAGVRPLALPEARPADFTVLVTVYPGPEAGTPGQDSGWARPARYALTPDGLLRAETGPGVIKPGYPPIARRLEPSQADRVYALVRDSGVFADPANRVPGPTVYEPPADARTVLIEAATQGRFRAAAQAFGPDAATAPLVRELATLSWLAN